MYPGIGPAGGYYPPVLPGQLFYGFFKLSLYRWLSCLPLETEITPAVIFDYKEYLY